MSDVAVVTLGALVVSLLVVVPLMVLIGFIVVSHDLKVIKKISDEMYRRFKNEDIE